MSSLPSALSRPTEDTEFHIDYDWWEKREDLRAYMLSHLPEDERDRLLESEADRTVDYIDPETGEVFQLHELQQPIRAAARRDDFINPHTSLVDNIFRVFLANGNQPQTARQLAPFVGKDARIIVKTIGGVQVYKGLRPVRK